MRDHTTDQALLYSSGELSPRDRADFELHLSSCAECRETLALAGAATRWAKTLAEEPGSGAFAAALSLHGGRGFDFSFWMPRAFALSAAAALAVFLFSSRPAAPLPRWDSDLSQRIQDARERLDASQATFNDYDNLRRSL